MSLSEIRLRSVWTSLKKNWNRSRTLGFCRERCCSMETSSNSDEPRGCWSRTAVCLSAGERTWEDSGSHRRTRAAKYELNKIQRLEAAGLTSSSLNDLHYAKVMNRGNPIPDKTSAPAGQTLAYNIDARWTPKPPDKLRQVNTNASSVASTNGHWPNDPIHWMVNTMLAEMGYDTRRLNHH